MASRSSPSARACLRALWLLGLTPPVTRAEVTAAWRERVARTHPDRHASAGKERAAEVLTRALNDARATLDAWIESGQPWPERSGAVPVSLDEHGPEPWPEREEAPTEAGPVDERTGLRAGDRVRVWPYDGEVEIVTGVERDEPGGQAWVRLAAGGAQRAERVRLAAYQCPVCAACAGPPVDELALRPCPDCLVDLRRLARAPREAARIRRAIEARAQGGRATANDLDDQRMIDRARDRERWARRLSLADPDALHAALLERFSQAFEAWAS